MHFFRQIRRLLYAVALSIDLLGSALTGGGPWETISARLGRARLRGEPYGTIGADLVDWSAITFFAQPNHCFGSLMAYEARMKVSAEIG